MMKSGAKNEQDGSSAERRTYDPTTRGWYTSTTSAYGDTLPSRTLDEKLPPLPRVISPPYLDRLGAATSSR